MLIKLHGDDVYCDSPGRQFDNALPTAVFIHGAQQDHSVWPLQNSCFMQDALALLSVDLPGHGRSKGTALTSIEDQARWLLALLDVLDVQQAILIGHSMGALIALEAAFAAPQRIMKLALLGAAFPMRVSDILLETAKQDEEKAGAMIYSWSHSSPALRTINDADRKSKSPGVLHADLYACHRYANGLVAAASLHCPVLFILASQDKMTPLKATNALTDAVPHGKILFLENCGHAMMEEQPKAVLQALCSFVTGQH